MKIKLARGVVAHVRTFHSPTKRLYVTEVTVTGRRKGKVVTSVMQFEGYGRTEDEAQERAFIEVGTFKGWVRWLSAWWGKLRGWDDEIAAKVAAQLEAQSVDAKAFVKREEPK